MFSDLINIKHVDEIGAVDAEKIRGGELALQGAEGKG
jgi:hypothetical protein